MHEEAFEKDVWRPLIDPSFFSYDSFLGLGFESVFIGVIAGLFFGFLVGIYPAIAALIPFLPATNILLFISYGVPLTGSTHFDPRLGVLSSTVLLASARAAQMLFGIAPAMQEFLVLAGVWSITQVFLIGYLPGKLISTSENLRYLFKGIAKVSLLYTASEGVIWALSRATPVSASMLLIYPIASIPLLLTISVVTTFIFTNTFCPYMMMPLITSALKGSGQRYCGGGNFVFKLGVPVKVDDAKIKKAQRKGFRLVSQLPSVTVFSCPRGGVISVYHSGDVLVRKVSKGTAERINRHLTPILLEPR